MVVHPDLGSSGRREDSHRRKELHYFDNAWQGADTALVEHYKRYFPRPPGKLVGEWTPRYLTDFWVPPLLAQAAPHARLLVMLRDPVDRFESAVQHELSVGGRPRPVIAADAAGRGLYHHHLTRLLRYFPRENVLVLQYERCRDDPLHEIAKTYTFLRLDASFRPPNLGERVNASSDKRRRRLSSELRAELATSYTDDVQRLADDFPEVDIALWRHFANGVPASR